MDSYSETLDKIYHLRGGEIDLRLDRMNQAVALFDHPEKRFPSIHIAGTNGKGSTAAMLHRILSLAGYRTALYTSPHLVSFTERIRVGDEEIRPNEVVEIAEEIEKRTASAGIGLTFFEFITVLAFVYFARQRVKIAVIEVGLGGRLDATNLITPLVSVITTISKDHEAYLGSDLLSIAREKGGIIKPSVPVVCGAVSGEVRELLKKIAADNRSPAYFLSSGYSFFLKDEGLFDYTGMTERLPNLSLALRGRHQRANAAAALAALELASRNFPVSEQAIREGLKTVSWPGRFELVGENPTILLDGAHNGEGVKALAQAIQEFRKGESVKFLFASMADKDWRLMLDTLVPVAREFVLTRVDMDRSADPRDLAAYLGQRVPFQLAPDARAGLDALLRGADPSDTLVVAGSLYLLGEIRPLLVKADPSKAAATKAAFPQS